MRTELLAQTTRMRLDRPTSPLTTVTIADQDDRELIYGMRHAVYARELCQYHLNNSSRLTDSLDGWNIYLVAKAGPEIEGFISITPPGHPSYSIDKYFSRHDLPFSCTDDLYEIRLLTVMPVHRRRSLA